MRRAKILCTLGPASRDEQTICELIAAGMNAARLNFSHGTESEHRQLFATIRRAAARMGQPIAILQDLQGPKIRVGRLPGGRLVLSPGMEVWLVHGDSTEQANEIPCSYASLANDLAEGDRLLLDDGRLALHALEISGKRVRCAVDVGGELSDHKGINLPGVKLSTPSLTDKDRRDLAVGQQLGVDYVALSFVRSANDVRQARQLVGGTPLIAKIEKPEAIDVIEGIVSAADGIMVARGDLGVEMGPEQVPMLQKRLIAQANAQCKLVITATEMLDSMRHSPRPTRAEVSDVANAILDTTDVVMLSGETATGAFPVQAVRTMHRVVCETEASTYYHQQAASAPPAGCEREITTAVARASVTAAEAIGSDAIICYTDSGAIALMASEYRPQARIIATTDQQWLCNRLALHWGVTPLLLDAAPSTAEQVISSVTSAALAAGLVKQGQDVVVAAGSRVDGPSDLIKIHRM